MLNLSKRLIRGPVDELEAITPEKWALFNAPVDDESEEEAFRFKIVARPATRKWKEYEKKKLSGSYIDAKVAIDTNDQKSARKIYKKLLRRPFSEIRQEKQKRYAMVRSELLVSLWQVFDDREAQSTDKEIEGLLAAPKTEGAPENWCDAAVAGLEDSLSEDEYTLIERRGESLADALARLIEMTSGEAERQRGKIDEEDVIAPLSLTPDSGPGSEQDERPRSIASA